MAEINGKKKLLPEFTKGILKENPVLCLVLGTCPTLAISTGAANAVGMGIAATLVLIGSNAVISALRKVIPDTVRIPAYITIIAGFVTIVQMLVAAFAPSIDKSLGIYLPLIVVNCIILGRAEMYANKNSVIPSMLDGLGMGVGFTAALLCMGIIREILGTGSIDYGPILEIFGVTADNTVLTVLSESFFTPITIFILPAGGFFVFGLMIAFASKLSGKSKKNADAKTFSCASCPMNTTCKTKACAGKENNANVD